MVAAKDIQLSCAPAMEYGVSAQFNHTVAHAIHSMTLEGLKLFNPQASARNGIPTVNRDTNVGGIVDDAPEVVFPSDSAGFVTPTMKVINALFSKLGEGTDGYSDAWSPIERVVHEFHMKDLWHAVRIVYELRVLANPPPKAVCSCMLDTQHNGIRSAVAWVADQYKRWTPITLLGRPIPKLTDNASWITWRSRITHYYDQQSLFDAATYMYCVVGGLAESAVAPSSSTLQIASKTSDPPVSTPVLRKTSASTCGPALYKEAGLSVGFNHTIAHAIHSMTLEGVRLFHPRATSRNGIPTVNRNTNIGGVVDDAPEVGAIHDSAGFVTPAMKVINELFANLGKGTDGYSEAWSPVERVVHDFHMTDLWHAVHGSYTSRVLPQPPSDAVCKCVLDTEGNGIRAAVQWVADQYKRWTPITLLGRPIPKLTDKESWKVWRSRITHYYDEQSLFDAATYMYCRSQANVLV
jgi:hypothetical protein